MTEGINKSTVVWDVNVFFGIRYYQNIPATLWVIKRNKEKKGEEHYVIQSKNLR